jgi:acetoin utilization deacetylase AcuC-like enzyme
MVKEIPVVYSPLSDLHNPQFEYFGCRQRPHQDSPQRTESIMAALRYSGFVDINESDIIDALPFALRVHDQNYLQFLKETSASAGRMAEKSGDPNDAIYPSVHRYIDRGRASNSISRRGLYMFDTYTPIMKNTETVALASAGVSVSGARMLNRGESLVYTVNRPPGHHAEEAGALGMCYLNNTAIAAQCLLDGGAKKVAIFDIDLHHGNGGQDIFYQRSDVLVVNINADPHTRFPHFTGYADEHGQGEGEGYNYNFPLPEGTDDALYAKTVDKALKVLAKYQPEYLLVSAGFDTHEKDPIGAFKLTTGYYQELGAQIVKLDVPILVIQEGGYASELLGQNVVSFLKGLSGNK